MFASCAVDSAGASRHTRRAAGYLLLGFGPADPAPGTAWCAQSEKSSSRRPLQRRLPGMAWSCAASAICNRKRRRGVARLFDPGLAQPPASRASKAWPLLEPPAAPSASRKFRTSRAAAWAMLVLRSLVASPDGAAVRTQPDPRADPTPRTRMQKPLLWAAGLPAGAQFRDFLRLWRKTVRGGLGQLEHLHSTDTGLYHLAAAMGIPLTTYFGPTQPERQWLSGVAPPPAADPHRRAGRRPLRGRGCLRPVCLEIPVARHNRLEPPAAMT